MTNAESEGSTVVELEIGERSDLIDDTTAAARTDDGSVIVSVQNGTIRIDRDPANALLSAAVEAFG